MSRLLWLLVNRSRYYVWNPVLWAQGKHFHFTKEEKFNTSQSILKVLLPPTRKMSFPGGSDGKHLPAMRETRVWSLGWEDLLEEEMATPPVFMPGESHGRRSLVGYSPWGHKESDTTERLHFHFTRKIKTGYVIVFPLTMIFWCIRIIRWMQPIALIKKYLTFA